MTSHFEASAAAMLTNFYGEFFYHCNDATYKLYIALFPQYTSIIFKAYLT